ncbi:MAG: YbaB/EbfC family nucleoid-associated protein [Candidatus Zipacnadales bacterium]
MRNPLQKFAISQLAHIQQSVAAAAAEAETELRATKIEASSGGGAVRVAANGLGELIEVKLDPNVITTEPEQVSLLEDLIAEAVRNVMEKASAKAMEVRQQKLKATSPFSMLQDLGIDLNMFGQ